MINEKVYVVVNQYDQVQWVQTDKKRKRYYRNPMYLKKWIIHHNLNHPNDIFEIKKCKLVEIKD